LPGKSITIYKLNGEPTSIQVTPDDNVGDLKIKIKDATKIPVEQQQLIFGTRILLDHEMLSTIPGNNDCSQIQLTLYIRSEEVVEAIKLVQNDGLNLQNASEELKSDPKVLEAVKQNGRALQFASADLKGDKDVVLAAVQQDGESLQYASQELQRDPEVVLAAANPHFPR